MACIGNMPSFKYVTVESLVITYNKMLYPIKTFVTNKKYIVWNIDRPYQLEDTNVRPESSLLEYLIVINDNGKPTIVEHEELLYSFNQTTNGSNLTGSTEYNALKSQVDKNTTKFNLVSNTVDDLTQIIGSTEELEDGSIIYNLNKVKSDSKSYGISIGEIQTKIDDKYAEIKPTILNDLVEYLRSVSEYKLSFTNVLEDVLITTEDLALINTNKTSMLANANKLQSTLSDLKVIIDSVNDTEKSQLVTEMKNKLSTLQNALVTICDSYLQDSKISGEEKTNIIQKTYELSTYIGTVQNTCSNITVNGQAGVVYSIENELLVLKDKTTSTIKELTRDTNNLGETVKSQSSEISQMKDNIKLKVEQTDVINTVDNKLISYPTTTQMNSAIDLTAGGILSTVSETYLNKQDANNTYATQSSLTQTSENIVATFSESGGYNGIINSGFKNGINSWDSQLFGTCSNNSISTWDDTNQYVLPGKCSLVIRATNLTDRYGVAQNVKVKEGGTYGISALSAGHRTKDQAIIIRNNDNNGTIIYSLTAIPSSAGKNVSGWKKMKGTFTVPSGCTNISVCLYMRGDGTNDNAYAWFTDVMLSEGNTTVPWIANSNELYDGIITADKDGVTVAMVDGEGTQGYAKMSYEGIATYDSDGNTKSWFGANDSAYIKELNVDIINNPYILQSKPRATSWYVGQTETGDGTGRNSSNKSNSIQSVLEYIRNTSGCYIYKQNINIYCDSGINLNENIYIGGWIGSGIILIGFGTASTFTGYIKVEECSPFVILDGGSTGWSNNDGCKWYREDGNTDSSALYVRNSSVLCRHFRAHRGAGLTDYGNTFAYADNGSSVCLYNNDLVKYYAICKCGGGSSMYVNSTRGDISVFADVCDSSNIVSRSSLPIFSRGKIINNLWCSTVNIDGTEGNNSLWMPKKIATTDPEPTQPTKAWNWVEKTFYFTLSSTTEGSGSTTSGWSDKWGQGKWGSYKAHRGHAKPTESISSWCNVGSNTRNISMTLTMTRLNTSHGYAGAVPVPKIKQKDGTYWSSGTAFARGDTKTITLSSGIITGLSDGTLSELTMWAGTSANDYSQYNTVKVKVKCEKYY